MKETCFYYKDINAPKPNKPNHIGTCALIVHNEKILLDARTDSHVWGLIGGALEIDESLLDGIKREIREETSIMPTDEQIELFGIYDDPSRIIAYPDGNVVRSISIAFILKLEFAPQLICSEESRELGFFSKKELASLNIVKTHQQIIDDYLSK